MASHCHAGALIPKHIRIDKSLVVDCVNKVKENEDCLADITACSLSVTAKRVVLQDLICFQIGQLC